jgi:GrpB-like predicted nucleotidyltransferase (UPF0157 family)
MTKELDKLSREELGQLFPVIISEPKPEWRDLFIKEKAKIINLLGENIAIRAEHIGSTAIPNLPSKPTIDILVEIPTDTKIARKIIPVMISGGYHHLKDHTEHLMFVKGYTPNGFEGQCYHIHLGPKDNKGLWDRLYFRDYLIANPSIAKEYATLKQKLAEQLTYDRDAYTEAKTEFIKKITQVAINSVK